tara:strand:- start:773 stop:1822 length:1050 start_codon:yes stop_codon:yes gene_type:complete
MDDIFDRIGNLVIRDVEKPLRKITIREKHFATAISVMIALILAKIPLFYNYTPITMPDNSVTFRVDGTWMQLGTQPFVFASMVSGFIFAKDKELSNRTYVLGLLFAVISAIQWTFESEHHWICCLQLLVAAYGMLQLMCYLDVYGSINFSTALIFAHASENIIKSFFSISTIWTIGLILIVSWLDELVVTVPLTHKKRRGTESMPVPLMYNSTSALIMYSTMLESLSIITPKIQTISNYTLGWNLLVSIPMLYASVHLINTHLPILEDKTGFHLIKSWKKYGYAIKGWRSDSKMAKHVQSIIDRNIFWNSILLCGLWTLGLFFKPSTNITTLFILTSTAKRHVNLEAIK